MDEGAGLVRECVCTLGVLKRWLSGLCHQLTHGLEAASIHILWIVVLLNKKKVRIILFYSTYLLIHLIFVPDVHVLWLTLLVHDVHRVSSRCRSHDRAIHLSLLGVVALERGRQWFGKALRRLVCNLLPIGLVTLCLCHSIKDRP